MKNISLITLISTIFLLPIISGYSENLTKPKNPSINSVSNLTNSEKEPLKSSIVIVDPKTGSVIETFKFDNIKDFKDFNLSKKLSM